MDLLNVPTPGANRFNCNYTFFAPDGPVDFAVHADSEHCAVNFSGLVLDAGHKNLPLGVYVLLDVVLDFSLEVLSPALCMDVCVCPNMFLHVPASVCVFHCFCLRRSSPCLEFFDPLRVKLGDCYPVFFKKFFSDRYPCDAVKFFVF